MIFDYPCATPRNELALFMESVDSFMMKKGGIPANAVPQMRLEAYNACRRDLYSSDVQILPVVARIIIGSNLEENPEARALFDALYNHAMDPVFIMILKDAFDSRRCQDLILNRGLVGAVLMKVCDKYIREKVAEKEKDKKDKKEKDETPMNLDDIAHIQKMVEYLLGDIADAVMNVCGNVTHTEGLVIAACLAMNSKETIKELIAADLPVSANIIHIAMRSYDLTGIIQGALLLEKSEVPVKPTSNQEKFLSSLKDWIFMRLNDCPTGPAQLYYFLKDGVYKSPKPDLTKYYIQIKDCGPRYTNLIQVAKQLTN